MEENYRNIWNALHTDFKKDKNNILRYDNWLDSFEYILKDVNTEIIDLGCGVTGNNTLYLLEHGKKVISCDFAEEALKVIKENIKEAKTLLFDMTEGLPFEDNSRQIVVADLSLHYFSDEITKRIIEEIKRVLMPNGYLIFRVNATKSTEYKKILENHNPEIEKNYFFSNNMKKRFFDQESLLYYFKDWKFEYMKEENMTRWTSDKIVWKCVVQVNKNSKK